MTKQVEAKLHEESKFWRASKPLPNQSSMQGRELEKESNIQQFRNPFAKISQACEMPKRSTSCRIESEVVKKEFRNLAKFHKPCENENEFRNLL